MFTFPSAVTRQSIENGASEKLQTLTLPVQSEVHMHSGGAQIKAITGHCPHFPKATDMTTSFWNEIEMLMNAIHHQSSEMI